MNDKLNYSDSEPRRINLREYGHEKSGQTTGNPSALKAELESIYQGRFIDESIKIGLTEEEKAKTREQIDSLNSDNIQIDKEIKNILNDCAAKDADIVNYTKEIEDIKLGRHISNISGHVFSPLKFGINLFFLTMLSVYLFLFYVSTVFKVFYFDAAAIAQNFANGTGTINALPSPGEMNMALKHNYLLLFAPFIFYAFGYAIHIVMERKSALKYLFVLFIVLVAFTLDFLMAFLIHSNISDAKEMIGLSSEKWSSSSIFWIILFMGFVVYIIWSILLDALLNEWKKRDVLSKRLELIKDGKDQISASYAKRNELEAKINQNKKEIEKLENGLKTYKIPISDIQHCIAQFSAGWMHFLSGSSRYKEICDECDQVISKFKLEKGI